MDETRREILEKLHLVFLAFDKRDEMSAWMEAHGVRALDEIRGRAHV